MGFRAWYVCALVLIVGVSDVRAQDDTDAGRTETGRQWLARCGATVTADAVSSHEAAADTACVAWIRGLIDMDAIYRGLGALERTPEGFCIPITVTWPEVASTIVQYLEERPSAHHFSARMLAYMALRLAYPCDGPSL